MQAAIMEALGLGRMIMIRQAVKTDIDAVENSYTELLTYEKEHGGSSNWVLGVYPTREVAERSYGEGTLYVLEEGAEICASMILNQYQSDDYREMEWMYPADDSEVLVIHTLCIPPSKAGRGYGKKMVQYAIEHARKMNCTAIRLDTWAGNEPAAALYQKFGFRYVGVTDVLLQGLIPEKQVFFEKKLDEAGPVLFFIYRSDIMYPALHFCTDMQRL